MPAPYGVTPTGFSRPSIAEELAIIQADQRANISATLDLSTDSVLGQVNGIFAERLGLAWEALQAIYDAGDPDRAEDDAATSIAKITGTDREGESKSTVDCKVVLALGTVLQAGVNFAHVTGKPDARFTPRTDFTATGPSDPQLYHVTFESEVAGPIQAPANTLTVIATPVIGWVSVTNDRDALPGRLVDDDADLRLRREQALQRSGSSGAEAIRADVLAVTNVTSCQVFENWTDTTDTQGLPPKSFQVVLFDDAGADNDAVAQAIWDSKPGGIQSVGVVTGTALDKNGDPHTMRFSRATQVNIYIQATVTPRDGYTTDTAFKLAIAQQLNSQLGTGDDVSTWDISDAAHGLGAKVTHIKIGTAPAPTLDDDIAIGNTQIARFDSSRITLTIAP